MKNILSKLKFKILSRLFKFFFYLKFDFIASLILCISIKKYNIINKKNNKTNILFFFKTAGIDDLKTTFTKFDNHKFNFYYLPRKYFRIIYDYYLGYTNLHDYDYKIEKNDHKKSLAGYNLRITNYIKIINKLYNFKCFISFNPFYRSDREIQKICSKFNIKFIALHKEGVGSPVEDKILRYLYKNKIEKFNGDYISVYSENEKDLMMSSKFAKNSQVEVVGSPRCDLSYDLRKIKPQNNTILYYMIERDRGIPWYFFSNYNNKNKNKILNEIGINRSVLTANWDELAKKTLIYCLHYARRNKEIKLIIKGKQSAHTNKDLPKKLPENVVYIQDGAGHHLLRNAKTVIAFNTTAVLEAMLANRNIIIPYFGNKNLSKKKNFVINFNNKKYAVYSKHEFFRKLNLFLKKKYAFKKMSYLEKKILNKFVGNSDGKSSFRLFNFLTKKI
tara:strand:+ start:16329 stop:17666 length:1338 start_codon:yes stop_codon:yes gene_type:complete